MQNGRNDWFCGEQGGAFWDLNVTWYGRYPDFTPCFKDTALLWIPTAMFWILMPFDLMQLHRNRGYPSKSVVGKIQVASLILTTLVFLAATIVNVALWRLGATTWFWWGFGSYLLYAFTLVIIIVLTLQQLRDGFTGSAAIWLFLFASVVCSSIHFVGMMEEKIFDGHSKENETFIGLFVAYFILTIVTLVSFSFSSIPVPPLLEQDDQKPFPEDFCSFPNKFSFGWVFPTIWKGYKRDLEIKDLWAIHPAEKAASLMSRFVKIFRSEFAPVVESRRFKGIRLEANGGVPPVAVQPEPKPPSMVRIFAKQFGFSALVAGVLEFFNVLLIFVEPIIVGLVTSFAANVHSEPIWHGYFYAAVMACSLYARSFLEQCAWFRMVRVGRNINSVAMGYIYRKALKVTSEARKSSTIGEIVNLMSVDAGRFFEFAVDMHMVWSAPLQFILGFSIAYRQVGVAVFAGVGYIVLQSLVNAFVTRTFERWQEEQMALKDERVKLLTEVLNGIKVIKLYGWEPAFQRRIQEIRNRELKLMRRIAYIGAFYEFSWHSTALVASFAVLATFVAISPEYSLSAQAIFVILSVFRILTFPLSMLPAILMHFVMVKVSLKRIVEFFSAQELDDDQISTDCRADTAVQIENATLAWDSTTAPTLTDISLMVPRGKLVAVVGKVGSGKSSLISAICGEMHKVSGTVSAQGSIAYVSQQAWIQNMTIQDNILFGKALNERNYNKVLDACCLKADLESLPAGDQTEIGERGINLSGGQKQRVSLARAVYQNRDLYLLDDPLSAVDVHVGKHIFQHVIGADGMLKDKTRILVTHVLTYLPECDMVVVIADGRIREAGTFQELVAKRGAFADFVQQYIAEAPEEELEDLEAPEFQALESLDGGKALSQRRSRQKTLSESERTSPQLMESIMQRLTSISSEQSGVSEKLLEGGADSGKLIDEELMQVGQVPWGIYITYAKAAGIGLLLYAGFVFVSLVFEMLGNIWLQTWSDNAQNVRENKTTEAISTNEGLLYLGLCGLGQMSFTLLLGLAFALFQVKASRSIHDNLLDAILKASMAFFDTTPTGRIINRCGKDLGDIDSDVPSALDQYSHFAFSLLYSIVGLFIFVPIFGGLLVPTALIYIVVQRVYITAGRRVRRLTAVTASPIYSHFQATLQGVSSIRAFGEGQRFAEISDQLMDTKFSALMARSLFNRWVAVYLDLIGNTIVTATAFAVVYMVANGQMSAGVAGLSLSSFALNLPGLLAWGVHVASMLEMELVSLERIVEYSNVKPEAPWTVPHSAASPLWPVYGRVLFRQYGTRYRDGLPLVLHNFSADIQPLEKVGVVGRTGAGKSSLTLALFRIIEAAEGDILIDDIDIGRLGLHELRRKLTIIPQDPVLFSGSLRMNLDPFDQYSDDELWLALERSKLKEFVSSLPEAIQYKVDEGGSNLSVGQRQLVCLARALLRKSKILVLDEATAAIDVETDSWIQATIREHFRDCTIITIAHRLNTILDSDRIMVLDSGRLVECDTPGNLAAREDSIFGSMLKETSRSRLKEGQ